MKDININGFDLKYAIEGKGMPALVIGSAIYYQRMFSPHLSEHLQMIFFDHRGFAENVLENLNKNDYNLDRVVEDIEEFRKYLGLEKMIVIGHSGHAFMALAYARKYNERVSHLVLVGAAPSNSSERRRQSMQYFENEASAERKLALEKGFSHLDADIKNDPQRRFVHYCIRAAAQSWYNFSINESRMWDGVKTNMQIIDYLWGDEFAKIDISQALQHLNTLKIPILLMLGKYDFLVGPFGLWDKFVPKYKNITQFIFEKSGHNPMCEEAELFDKRLLEWLDTHKTEKD